MDDVLLVVATLVGTLVQTAVGFGFAFFVAPVAVAVLAPPQAVALLLVLGLAINALVLFGERRPRRLSPLVVIRVTVIAIPGMVLGAFVVRAISPAALQVAVGLLVLAAAWLQLHPAGLTLGERHPQGVLAGAGALTGLLTTAASLNGPALALAFLSIGKRGNELRDHIAGVLLSLGVFGSVILLLVGGAHRTVPDPLTVALCVVAAVAAHQVSVRLVAPLGEARHRRLVLGASLAAGAVSVLLGLLG